MKFKILKSDDRKLPKQAEDKRDGVLNPQNYNQFKTEILMHSNATNQTKSTVELG